MSRRQKLKSEITELGFNMDADGYVYVILIDVSGFGNYYYVGSTSEYGKFGLKRIAAHSGSSNLSLPYQTTYGTALIGPHLADKIGLESPEYDVIDHVDVDSYHSPDSEGYRHFKARLKHEEHQKALEIAIQHNTTKVLGI